MLLQHSRGSRDRGRCFSLTCVSIAVDRSRCWPPRGRSGPLRSGGPRLERARAWTQADLDCIVEAIAGTCEGRLAGRGRGREVEPVVRDLSDDYYGLPLIQSAAVAGRSAVRVRPAARRLQVLEPGTGATTRESVQPPVAPHPLEHSAAADLRSDRRGMSSPGRVMELRAVAYGPAARRVLAARRVWPSCARGRGSRSLRRSGGPSRGRTGASAGAWASGSSASRMGTFADLCAQGDLQVTRKRIAGERAPGMGARTPDTVTTRLMESD